MVFMKVFVVGDICLDVLCCIRERAALGEEKHIDNLTFSLGGNAANFAFAAAKLGLKPELFSALGKDFASAFLKQQVKSAGIKPHFIEPGLQNSYTVLLVEKNGQRFAYSSKGSLEKLTAKGLEKSLLQKLHAGDLVFFGGYFHIPAMHSGFPKLLKKIREKNCLIGFDLCFDEFGKWKIFHFLSLIDFLFLNDLELARSTKKKSEKSAIAFLFSKGASNVILKKGQNGSAFFSKDFFCKAKAFPARAVDTTGAGDIFNAAFLKAFFSGADAKKCLEFANFAAAKKIERHGLFVPAQSILKRKLQ
jgi:sugar/nucleoside kinase (ribokinase family)